jgi:organic radical activating enzyme
MPGIIAFIESNQSTLKNLGLLGGEPLLQKENDQLLDAIGPDVHINLITNLSVPLENNQIFKKLLDKNRVVWDISFDTVEQKFEYVRHGASWDLLLKNIRYLQDAVKDRPGHLIGVASVYSVYNALNLSQVHEYFADNNLPNMRWNELNNPVVLSVINLPKQFRDLAAQELEKSIPYHKWHRQKTFLQEMANSIRNTTTSKDNCNDLYEWHSKQEQTYWPDFKYRFADLWPEYRT